MPGASRCSSLEGVSGKTQGLEEASAIHYFELGRDRASGMDGVSWKEYGEHLDANLNNLVARMKAKRYKPQPARRVYIPKDEHSVRPLGLPTVNSYCTSCSAPL